MDNNAPLGELIPVGGGDPIPLIREEMVLGRLESCDICLRWPNVSKRHCRFVYENGFWWIEDLGSTNGVKVNGTRITARRLIRPDDVITIARREWTLEYEPPVGQHAIEEILEDEPWTQPLLEKAGLVRPRRDDPRRRKLVDPRERLLEEDEED